MSTWILFAVLGCGLGFFLSITGFALIALAVVASHGIVMVAAGTAASGLVLRLVFTAVALQVGYFAAILIRMTVKRLRAPNSPQHPTPTQRSSDRHGTDSDPSLPIKIDGGAVG